MRQLPPNACGARARHAGPPKRCCSIRARQRCSASAHLYLRRGVGIGHRHPIVHVVAVHPGGQGGGISPASVLHSTGAQGAWVCREMR